MDIINNKAADARPPAVMSTIVPQTRHMYVKVPTTERRENTHRHRHRDGSRVFRTRRSEQKRRRIRTGERYQIAKIKNAGPLSTFSAVLSGGPVERQVSYWQGSMLFWRLRGFP
eukprot:1335600-Amorphochlora_amoeboformis.AAC.1